MRAKQTCNYIVLFLISLLLCILIQINSLVAVARNSTANQTDRQVQSVVKNYTIHEVNKTIEFWEAVLKNPEGFDLAIVRANLATAYSKVGRISEAISQWQEAALLYQKSNNKVKLAEVLVDRAQAYNLIGQFPRAIPLLEKAISLATASKSEKTLATAWGVLGNAYSLTNRYDRALAAYQKSLDTSKTLDSKYVVTALNNQVTTWSARAKWYELQAKSAEDEGSSKERERLLKSAALDRDSAKAAAIRALEISRGSNNLTEVSALLNLLHLSPQEKQYEQQASHILDLLPDSRSKAYSLIELAAYEAEPAKLSSLKQASSVSASLNDWRTQSFALGELGHFYEQQENLQVAMQYTRSAILASQKVMALDSLYRWQWQAGRIYNADGLTDEAIASYKEAIASLQSIRGDVASASRDLQFDVRDRVEPVYRQLIGLLLDKKDRTNISEALEVTELLKLTELQNFFGDDCFEVKSVFDRPVQNKLANTAIINTVVLNNKIYIVLQAKNEIVSFYSIPISSADLENKIKNFRDLLEDVSTQKHLSLAQELYNLLIKPIQKDLDRIKPNELTFINDGILRNIPMAALYDGQYFLIEKYPISYALGSNLSSQNIQLPESALIFGLTVKTSGLAALPNVASETQAIQKITGGRKFLDKNFTELNLEKQIRDRDYSVVHIATHGEFKGTVNSSSLQAFDKRISLQKLENILRLNKKPLDLLTLSACQTAAGDNRSTLGIAGLAARTGVRNILASLWYINDGDTVSLVEDFYTQMKKTRVTKAEALREAQIRAIGANTTPAVWSSFILISS